MRDDFLIGPMGQKTLDGDLALSNIQDAAIGMRKAT